MQIYSFNYNGTTFFEKQVESFKKSIQHPFEFYSVDNSSDSSTPHDLKRLCSKLNVNYLEVKNKNHSLGGLSHQTAMNYVLRNHVKRDSPSFFVDFDTYMMKPVNLYNELEDNDFVGIQQSRNHIRYFHPGFLLFDSRKVNPQEMDLFGGHVDGIMVDSGGQLSKYISKYNSKLKGFSLNYFDDFGFELIGGFLMHFRAGSNWDRNPRYHERLNKFNDYYKQYTEENHA